VLAIRQVSGRILEETSKVRDLIKAIASIESQEREREREETKKARSPRKAIAWVIWLSPTCKQRGNWQERESNSLHGR
jgi:hypothetical protein